MTTRRGLVLAAGAAAVAPWNGAAAQGAWPDRPVRIIVPFAPAGATDLSGRLLADRYSALLGQSFVVENRAGAAGIIGVEVAMRSAPDGHTLLLGTISTHAMNVPLYRDRLPYDPLRDFVPVTRLTGGASAILVHPSIPVTDVKGLIDYAKARPGELNYGSGGNGTTTHLGAEMFKHLAGVDVVHVPFRAPTQATVALAAGQVQMMVDTLVATRPLVREGRLRMLAVSSAQRLPEMPDLPTVAETLPGFELNVWVGMFLPAGTPRPIVERLDATTRAILAEPAVIERLASAGAVAAPLPSAEFATFIRQEIARWTEVVRAANIVLD